MNQAAVIQGGPSRYLDRPRFLAFGGVVLASLAAWVALAVLHDAVPYSGFDSGINWLVALCRGVALPAGTALPGAVTIWVLMSIAMMLPTAAPAVDIYVRLSRRLEARRAAHVAGFAGGYLTAWAGLAVVAGGAQVALGARIGEFAAWMPQNALAGGLLLLVGLYQLTPLKQACLTLCRPEGRCAWGCIMG
jgi:predicted metal-binding membrane protein